MRIVEYLDFLDARSDGLGERGTGRLANAIDGEDRRAVEARGKIRRGGMRQVVRHEVKSLAERAPEQFVDRPLHLTDPERKGFLKLGIPPFGAIVLAPPLG